MRYQRELSLGLFCIAFSGLLAGCGTTVVDVRPEQSTWTADKEFSRRFWRRFPEAKPTELGEAIPLFGTYYYTPTHGYSSTGVPILTVDGEALGPRLSLKDFCNAADEGAFRAKPGFGKRLRSYTISASVSGSAPQADCSPVFRTKLDQFASGSIEENWPLIVSAFERTRYRQTSAPYGNGKGEHWLVPWRTVATYNLQITQGTVLYIPHVRGARVTLPSGQSVTHDGYFFAADSGSGIKSGHVDFFTGGITPRPNLLPGVDGRDRQFVAYVVKNEEITAHFKGLHRID